MKRRKFSYEEKLKKLKRSGSWHWVAFCKEGNSQMNHLFNVLSRDCSDLRSNNTKLYLPKPDTNAMKRTQISRYHELKPFLSRPLNHSSYLLLPFLSLYIVFYLYILDFNCKYLTLYIFMFYFTAMKSNPVTD